MSEEKQSHDLLEAFKERMRIFHDMEDNNLSRILSNSQAALTEKFDVAVEEYETGRELILERSRFVYNDKLEAFESSFASELYRFALAHTLNEEENNDSSR
ncbi:phage gp6-like head-tail connector protein [Streptococcus suis]|nr:phage gp6-like head-tail connector protein [Streptococcus suis]HEM3878455.1 phage gp6-like head-tail connector protein [Streptococcus suis]HEM3895690.1 phage gp6-like head-tail connector protein [Streptococcus suis]HEM3903859.1 phage gp6-like head-tail connector protein [Streptococcus suis]